MAFLKLNSFMTGVNNGGNVMPFMRCDEVFDLGIKEFDEHHKHFVALLDMTNDVLAQGVTHDGIAKVLDELVGYTKYHFSADESWMEENKYPFLSQHRNEHELFCQRVNAFQRDFLKQKTNLSIEVLLFLNNWLTTHILKSDAYLWTFCSGIITDWTRVQITESLQKNAQVFHRTVA